jgi:hypothetical protein
VQQDSPPQLLLDCCTRCFLLLLLLLLLLLFVHCRAHLMRPSVASATWPAGSWMHTVSELQQIVKRVEISLSHPAAVGAVTAAG